MAKKPPLFTEGEFIRLSEQQLGQVKDHAALLFSPKEIAVIMDLDPKLFLLTIQSDNMLSRAYYKGKLDSEAKVRRSIIEKAAGGDLEAQALALELMKDVAKKEIS